MNILLLEPDYQNKYPPIGLMKLAFYHKEFRGDFVWFNKGALPTRVSSEVREKLKTSKYYNKAYDGDTGCLVNLADETIATKNWDRIYITTLFTFEWDKTVELIRYAQTLVSNDKIFIGGILATLMPDEIETETGIKPTIGLLHCSQMIGYDDVVNIDKLIPDYSILDHIEYIYPDHNAYFTSCTKGCGMKCSFCAVQKLEPDYEPYIPIKSQIEAINELYGTRRNLLLMDNNVLKSPYFKQIIEDIIAAGFARGATYINEKTGKPNKRYLDFNQGLDANLLTDEKAKLLAMTALKPAHIAFDHIDDTEKYMRALTIAEANGLDEAANYMLFNTPDFKGKGKNRRADTPEDLYKRIRMNVDFAEERNKERCKDNRPKFQSYSFPMQFIPLGAKNREYLGDNWTPKTYQAVKRMIHISKGVIYSRKTFFESVWGANVEEFQTRLLLPKRYIEECLSAIVALTSAGTKHKNINHNNIWTGVLQEWMLLYDGLKSKQKTFFTQLISDNIYTLDRYIGIKEAAVRLLYLNYFSSTALVSFLEKLRNCDKHLFIEAINYLGNQGAIVLEANTILLQKLKGKESYEERLKNLFNINQTIFSIPFSFQILLHPKSATSGKTQYLDNEKRVCMPKDNLNDIVNEIVYTVTKTLDHIESCCHSNVL